ncbi:MAG: transporter [Myxococcales bacterium]|nr:transporter [Myxococcales bacterium]
MKAIAPASIKPSLKTSLLVLSGVITLGAGAPVAAQSKVAQPAMRPLSTDRPDVTESPKTVDGGHFQLEADLVHLTRDQGDNSWGFAVSNLKLGLLDFVDLQLVVEPLRNEGGPDGRRWGFGDLTMRLKVNLFGNDEGEVALAVMPWGKYPTSGELGNDAIEGGLIVPLGIALPHDLALGLMAEFDVMGDSDGAGHHFELMNTASFGFPIVGSLGGYIEAVGVYSAESGVGYVVTANAGLTLGLGENVQLDAGTNIGVTGDAEDLVVFSGISFRH